MSTVITAEDVALAQQAADWADARATVAWARVDIATSTAQAAEAEAERCRALAYRVSCQVGFRIAEAS